MPPRYGKLEDSLARDSRRYEGMCKRKFKHETADSAQAAIIAHNDPKMLVYLCPFCGKYHLGHKKKDGK